MPIFIYKGRNRLGRRVKGDIDAPSLEMVEAALRRRGFTQLKVKPKPKDLLAGTFLEGKVGDRDKVVFSRQFATMINAGVPILQSLQIMCEQTENKVLRRILYSVRNDIEGGSSLFEALRKYPKVFEDLYAHMVHAGETGGILDSILLRLADYLEKAARLKARVKSAMVYPGVVVSVAVAVIAIIMIFVIPTFEEMFKDFGAALPLPTQIVINMSRFTQDNLLWMIATLVISVIVFKRLYRFERVKIFVDFWILMLPVFGPLMRKVAVARFSRTLSTMVSSGVPILSSLDIVARTTGNKTVELGVLEAKKSIAEGQSLADPLEATGVFPPMVIQMISIGESTGSLDHMLSKVADFYDNEVDVAVETLTSLLEPMMIVFLGVVVGGLVVSMYLPIFKIGETLM
jgi:type IV pilus assembly protein PilC